MGSRRPSSTPASAGSHRRGSGGVGGGCRGEGGGAVEVLRPRQHLVRRHADAAARRGVSVLLGPSGTGKSVFLKSLIGLLKPEQGSIVIHDTDLVRCSESRLYELRKLFGVLFQDGALFGSMNLYDNIAFPLREHTKKSESEIRDIVEEKMDDGRAQRRRDEAARARSPVACASGRGWPGRWCSTRDHPVRRAGLRPRPGAHRLPQPADHRPERADRRDVPDRHPRHQHRADRAGQHRHALPQAPGDVRPARGAADLARSRWSRQFLNGRRAGPDRHVGGEGRRAGRPRDGRGRGSCRGCPRSSRSCSRAAGVGERRAVGRRRRAGAADAAHAARRRAGRHPGQLRRRPDSRRPAHRADRARSPARVGAAPGSSAATSPPRRSAATGRGLRRPARPAIHDGGPEAR